jgi:enterochelin esterase-like enzyme
MNIFLCLLVIFLTISTVFAQDLPIPKSQLMTKLETDVTSGKMNAVEDFWKYAKSKGTPLIETITDEKQNALVTFIWRGDAETKNVFVQSNFYTWILPRRQLTNIENTDIWYKTAKVQNDARLTYQFSVNDPRLPFPDPYDWFQIKVNYLNDPLNKNTFVYPKDEDDPNDSRSEVSLLEMPSSPKSPYKIADEKIKKGRLEKLNFKSEILANERRIWFYTPNGYTPNKKYPLVIYLDGVDYLNNIPSPTILDNLIAERKIPPVVAVFVATPFGAGIREKEYYGNLQFVDFMIKELIPFVNSKMSVTKKPSETTIVGLSASGVAAGFLALKNPERFGNVIMQSPALWWGYDYYGEDGEWLTEQYINAEKKKIRFYVEIGKFEALPSTRKGRPNAFHAVRHFRNILKLKGYEYFYSEFTGAHEYTNWGESLPNALIKILSRNKK